MKTQVLDKKNSKEIVLFRSTKDLTAQRCETDHYFWLKIDFNTINAYNVALRFESDELKILYLLPSVLIKDGSVSFEHDIHSVSIPIPQYIDLKDYEKRIENNSIVLVFFKKYKFTKMEFFY